MTGDTSAGGAGDAGRQPLLSAIANFLFIPYDPFWSVLIIVLHVFVIWALSGYGRHEAEQIGMAS